MIHPIENRYGSPQMRQIFDKEKKLEFKLKIEAILAEALAELSKTPPEAAKEI